MPARPDHLRHLRYGMLGLWVGLRATDADGNVYAVFNVYFQQDALLFAACS